MKIKKNIIFFYDSGKKIGSGHFGRCLTFSKYIHKVNSKYKFFFVSNDRTFSRIILNSGSNFLYLKNKNYQSFYKILKKLNPKYIFIDSYLLNFSTKKKNAIAPTSFIPMLNISFFGASATKSSKKPA